MKVYKSNDNQMVVPNVKEPTANNLITNRQNGQVMLLNTSAIQTSISPQQLNQSILISTAPQMTNMPSSGKGDILLSNVHLVSALQSPIIWPGDGIIKQTTVSTDKTAKDNERIIRSNPPTIISNDLSAQSTAPTFLTIMTPQTNTVFNNSHPQQLIMLGELAPNQIILTSPGLDENAEILQCKQVSTAETGRIKIEPLASKVLVINEKSSCGQMPQSSLPPVNAVPTADLSARVEVTDGRGPSKKRSRKVNVTNSITQTTTESNIYPSINRQDSGTQATSKLILTANDLQNQIGSLPRNSQSSDGTNEIGYTAQLLSQLNDTGALPAISCSQVSSVLSALEPAGTGSSAVTAKPPQPQPPVQTAQGLTPNQLPTSSKSTTSPKPTRETHTKPVDSEKLKYHLRAQYSVLTQEDHVNNLPAIYKCSECLYLSTNSSTIVTHFERFHQVKSTLSLPKRNLLKCIGCSNVFYSKHALQVHLIQDHEASSAEVSVITNIIVKSQSSEVLSKETRKEDVANTDKAEQDFSRRVNAVEQPAASKADNVPSTKSIVIDLRSPSTSVTCVSTSVPINSVSPVPNLNSPSLDLSTIDSTELTSAQCMVDLTAQFSAAAHSLMPTVVQQGEIANVSNAVAKDEETADGIANKNDVEMKEDEQKLTREDKSGVKMRAPTVSTRKRGRPKSSQTLSHIQKKVVDSVTKPEKDKHYQCSMDRCGLRFNHEANLVYHHQCHKKDTFECPECSTCKPKWANMAMHLWTAHNIDMELLSCTKCSYKTYVNKFLNIHVLTHGDEKPFLCDLCGKGFKTRKQMRNHKAMHKSNSEQESAEGDANTANKFSCTLCGRKMKDGRNLRLHMENVHHKMRRYFCTFCNYTTYSRGSLLIHQRIHTGEKPFKCDSCDYASSDHNSLRRHKMQHSGDKPYNCPHCSYACIQSSTFKAHLKSKHPGLDTGLMFSCTECPFRTINKANLLSHRASHVTTPRQGATSTDPPTASTDLQVLNLMSSAASHFLAPAAPAATSATTTVAAAAAAVPPSVADEPTPVSLEVAEIVDPALEQSPLPILGLPHGEIIISDHLGFEDSSESCEMIIPESQGSRR